MKSKNLPVERNVQCSNHGFHISFSEGLLATLLHLGSKVSLTIIQVYSCYLLGRSVITLAIPIVNQGLSLNVEVNLGVDAHE